MNQREKDTRKMLISVMKRNLMMDDAVKNLKNLDTGKFTVIILNLNKMFLP